MSQTPNLSVIIPLYNEDESIGELCDWIDTVLTKHELSYEVIIIDDGSTDSSWNCIEEIGSNNRSVKGIKFNRNYGKSAGLNAGFKQAIGEVIVPWTLTCRTAQKNSQNSTK